MKKILMLTAFALAGLAAAQSTPAPTTPPTDTSTGTNTGTTDTSTGTTTDTSSTSTTTTQSSTTQTGTTTNTGTGMQDMNMMNPASMSAADNFTRAQEFAVQADVAYPVPFYDRTLWKAAVDSAYYAAAMDQGNRDYQAYLAQLYTKTQWWINAYNAWTRLGNLNDQEKQWAALSAAKLAYIALQRGDRATARTYVQQGMQWANTPSLQAIQSRL